MFSIGLVGRAPVVAPGGVDVALRRYQPGIGGVDRYRDRPNSDGVRVSVLGPVVVEPLDRPLSPRDRVVLTALALGSGEPISGERLADALWGDDVPSSWNKVVQGCIVRLRRALGTDAIETHPLGYRLSVPPDDIDLRRFERLLGRSRELLALGQVERAMVAADEALALWRGRPLVDAEDWEPARVEALRLEELRLDAEELRLDAALRSGRHREVLASARAYVEASPTRERRWELLALAQYRAASQGDALRTLNEARAVLGRELGVDPGPDLVALEQAILRQDPSLAPPEAPAEAGATCPWPGLPAYGIDEAESFFGRERETATCLHRLATDGVVVVVGPSGSGKSSLVRAGIAGSLRRNGRRVVVLTPGSRPRDALTALPSTGQPAVVIVDQCEEAVTLCEDADERSAFFDALVAYAGSRPLVVALRADRVGDVSSHHGFARLVERGLFLLGPMSEANLRAAIDGPARQSALLLEPGLVDLVVRDVLDEPGALPLMSHALLQTWARRQGRTLTVAAYQETGGIRGAVAQSAESVYAAVDPDHRSKLRELLLRLVAPGDSSEPARARVPRHALTAHPANEELIERLVTARLLTSDDEVVELAHEALARAWPRLRDWLQEDVEGVRALRHLTAAALEWDALGRPESELYRGVRLAQALAWRARTQPELTAAERAFLEASVELEATELHIAQAQVTSERRTVRRLRRLVIGVALLATAAVLASAVALGQRSRADDEARIAEARRVSAQALVARPYDRALLLAVEAVRLWDSAETRGNLLTTIARSGDVMGLLRSPGDRLLDFDLTPTSGNVAVADVAGHVTLFDVATRDVVARLSDAEVAYGAPTFSPDGNDLAVSRIAPSCFYESPCDASIDVFAADDLRPRRLRYSGLGSRAADIAYSPDGSLIAGAAHFAVAEPSANIAVWRAGVPGEPLRRLTLEDRGIDLTSSPDAAPRGWIRFSPDGTKLYASGAGPVVVFDVASGGPLRSFDGQGGLALSADGTTIAIARAATRVALVDASSGATRAELTGHGALVTAAAFSADGRFVATTSNDETVAIWDTATGERVRLLEGHAGSVRDVAFGVDGGTLYTSAADRSVFMWNISGSSGLSRSVGEWTLDVAAEATTLVSPSADSIAVLADRAHLVDVRAERVIELAVEPYEVAWGSYSPDGRSLVTVGGDGATKLWRIADGVLVASQDGRGHDNLGAVAFAQDGKGVAVADADGTIRELSATTLQPTGRTVHVGLSVTGIRTAPGGRFAVIASSGDGDGTDIVFGELGADRVSKSVHIESAGPRANFSADGSRYAFGGFDGRLGVVDVATGRVTGPRDPVHAGPIAWVTFSPDGLTLASMGFDGELVLSDAATGAPRARVRPGAANQHATVGYHPDGHTAMVAYRDGTVIAYETDPQAWLAHACRVAGRDLTVDEWRDAFGGEPRRRTCSHGR